MVVVDCVVSCAITGSDSASTTSDPKTTANSFLDFIQFSSLNVHAQNCSLGASIGSLIYERNTVQNGSRRELSDKAVRPRAALREWRVSPSPLVVRAKTPSVSRVDKKGNAPETFASCGDDRAKVGQPARDPSSGVLCAARRTPLPQDDNSKLTVRTWEPGAGRRWGRGGGGGWRRLPLEPSGIPGRCGGRRCVACSSADPAG